MVADGDATTVEELDLFRKDVGSFVRLCNFLSQIVNYADTDLEKRSLFLRLLLGRLTGRVGAEAVGFSTVELTRIKQARSGDHDLDLDGGELVALRPVAATGTGAARGPRMVRLAEVLVKINDLFSGEDFTPAEQQSWVEGLVTVLMDDDIIRAQAGANARKQFVESPDLSDAVTEAVLGNQTSHHKMADYFFTDDRVKVELVKLLASWSTRTSRWRSSKTRNSAPLNDSQIAPQIPQQDLRLFLCVRPGCGLAERSDVLQCVSLISRQLLLLAPLQRTQVLSESHEVITSRKCLARPQELFDHEVVDEERGLLTEKRVPLIKDLVHRLKGRPNCINQSGQGPLDVVPLRVAE